MTQLINLDLTQIDFAKYPDGLMPCIVQEVESKEVLMLAFVNLEALQRTMQSGNATFWTRTRQEIWEKGLSSGDVLKVQEIRTDCDKDTLIYHVEMVGEGACHKPGWKSCFGYRVIS